jgi:hypothetical protein
MFHYTSISGPAHKYNHLEKARDTNHSDTNHSDTSEKRLRMRAYQNVFLEFKKVLA